MHRIDYDGILWIKTFAILLQAGVTVKDALTLSKTQIKTARLRKQRQKKLFSTTLPPFIVFGIFYFSHCTNSTPKDGIFHLGKNQR
jgi:predicted secreted protein